MTHPLMLLLTGLGMMSWRPCRSRGDRAPRLALAMLLTSAAAVWMGSFGVLVGGLSGQLGLTTAACGTVWRQLLGAHLPGWQAALAIGWLFALPGRGVWAVATEARRTRAALRTFTAAGRPTTTRDHPPALIVPGLQTPAVTLGALRPVVLIDRAFWQDASPIERDIVLTHEHGHVRGRHGLIGAAAHLLLAGLSPLPAAAEVSACIRRHLEALADDAAVRRHNPRTVGMVLGRIALWASPTTGLGAAGASVWRVQRLLATAPLHWTDRALMWATLATMALCLALATAQAAHALGPLSNPNYCTLR